MELPSQAPTYLSISGPTSFKGKETPLQKEMMKQMHPLEASLLSVRRGSFLTSTK